MRTARSKEFLPETMQQLSAVNIAQTLYKIPTLLTTWTRCGKPRCRCRDGQLHGPYHALFWREGTHQRRKYVKSGEVAAVRIVLADRRAERRAERQAFVAGIVLLQHLTALERRVSQSHSANEAHR